MEPQTWFDRFDAAVEASRAGPPPRPPKPPASISVPLPGGHAWRVRATLEPAQVLEWRSLLTTEGATFATWHRFFRLVDLGWTLPCPSPADMPDTDGWRDVPDDASAAVVDWLAVTVAGVLAEPAQRAA